MWCNPEWQWWNCKGIVLSHCTVLRLRPFLCYFLSVIYHFHSGRELESFPACISKRGFDSTSLMFSVLWCSVLYCGLTTCSQKVYRKVSRSQSSSHSDWFISRALSSVEERFATLSVLFICDHSEKTLQVQIKTDYRRVTLFFCFFFRRMAFSLSPLILLRTCSLFCERGAAGPPPNPRTRRSRGWPCSAWQRWSTSCTPAVPQSGRWRSGPSWRATSSSSTGTVRLAASSRTGRAGRTAWSRSRDKC